MSTETALRTTIRATLDGWPVDVEIEIAPARLSAALLRLAELGYTPRAAEGPGAVPGLPSSASHTKVSTDMSPIAPIATTHHNGVMIDITPALEIKVWPRGARPITVDSHTAAALLVALGEPTLQSAIGQMLRSHLASISPRGAALVELAEQLAACAD